MSESGIFKAAVKLPPERRAAYLDQACGSDAQLRAEIESLLHAHDATGGFLEHDRDMAPRGFQLKRFRQSQQHLAHVAQRFERKDRLVVFIPAGPTCRLRSRAYRK